MILNLEGVTKEELEDIVSYIKSKGVGYKKYNSTWECFIHEEMEYSVPIYLENNGIELNKEETEELIKKCVYKAINKSEYLLSGDTVLDFIESVEKYC